MFGYRYDTETGLYYLQSRYYNPEWGRFINADAIVGQTGELLGHNLFAYCKNNPVNRQDTNGFMSIRNDFTDPDDIPNDNGAGEVVNEGTNNISNNSKSSNTGYNYKGAGQSLVTNTLFSIGESVGSEATLGYNVLRYGRMPIPVVLSTFEEVGRFFKAASGISLCLSLSDNFSGKYSKGEAWIRTGIDITAFVATGALFAGAGWVPVLGGVAIGLGAEGT